MFTGRGQLPAWLAAAGAVLAVIGVAAWLLRSPTADEPDTRGAAITVVSETPPPGTSSDSGTGSGTAPVRASWKPGVPRQVTIPALDVVAAVVPATVTNDTLIPPSDPEQLGWWAEGARPGAKRGSALVAGHTVHTGGGALDHLEDLTPGEQVMVRTDRGRIVYEVKRVRIYTKGRIAQDAERLFSQEAPGRLVLITCEDWDGSRYLSNVVVVAAPVSA